MLHRSGFAERRALLRAASEHALHIRWRRWCRAHTAGMIEQLADRHGDC